MKVAREGEFFGAERENPLAGILGRLPVGVVLYDRSGRIVLRSGALSQVWGPTVASRDPKAWDRWEVFADDSSRIDRPQWPTALALQGRSAFPGVAAIYHAQPGETHQLRTGAIAVNDGRGFRGAIAVVHPIERDDPRQLGLKGYLQDRFADALIDACVQSRRGRPTGLEHDIRPDRLTRRETQVLRRIAWGKTYKRIAGELEISVRTVEFHRNSAVRKLRLRSRADMLRYALNHNWLDEAPRPVMGERQTRLKR